jgi:transglutaminase-like putative cysteine protease
MKKTIKLFTILFIFARTLLPYTSIFAQSYDFSLSTNTKLNYTTGKDYIGVVIEYTRKINNKGYYFSKEGEQTFHIPDSASEGNEYIEKEREYILNSLRVTSDSKEVIEYTLEKKEVGEGIYIKVPNYKQTEYGSNYKIYLEYLTHDYVKNVYNWVLIEYPGLHKDTKFEQINSDSNTKTEIKYNLDIIVDDNIPTLAKVFPSNYSQESKNNETIFSFDGRERISTPVSLEFGTNQAYRFEIEFNAPKTDTLVSEKYSSVIDALSTNIYELSLPREFDENTQRVLIEEMIPKPTGIINDEEGNVIARFEVPANQDTPIYMSGYITVQQNPYTEARKIPNLTYDEYKSLISKDNNLSKYLTCTTYWQSTNPIIQNIAIDLLENQNNFLEILKSNYSYINNVLEYSSQKAKNPHSERIGAIAALQGGDSVCMEYSDSMIAILRAQGIPSRVAFGYTSLDTDIQQKIGHQWVQVWVPEYGWLSIDPSYESPNMMIGQSLQYILWDTFYGENLSNIRLFSANNTNLDSNEYYVKIYAVSEEEILAKDSLVPYSEISFDNTDENLKDTVNLIAKTTIIGKALIVVFPILVILILLIIILALISTLIKRFRNRRVPRN